MIISVCQVTVHSDTFFERLLGTCLYNSAQSHLQNTKCGEKRNEEYSADEEVSIDSSMYSVEYQDIYSIVKRKSIWNSYKPTLNFKQTATVWNSKYHMIHEREHIAAVY